MYLNQYSTAMWAQFPYGTSAKQNNKMHIFKNFSTMFFLAHILLIRKLQTAVVKTLLIQSWRIANQMNSYKLNYKFYYVEHILFYKPWTNRHKSLVKVCAFRTAFSFKAGNYIGSTLPHNWLLTVISRFISEN